MPARRFWKMSLNAKPIATPPTPRVETSRPGVMLGNTTVIAMRTAIPIMKT